MRWLPSQWLTVLAVFLMVPAMLAAAAEAYVKIISPADGAKLDAMNLTKLVYEARPGPKGSHVHVYVDGKEIGILQQLKGSYTLETLSPGQRSLCVKVVNKAHVPVGIEQCIQVTVK